MTATPLRRVEWLLALGLSLWIGLPVAAADSPDRDKQLEVVVLDVGQGDGIYIRTPGGKNILIDAGPDARRGVLPFLRSRKIRRIDSLVLSHPHMDHIGGARAVMAYADVREVLDSGRDHTASEYHRLLKAVRDRGIPYRQPRSGDRLDWDPDLTVEVLHPDAPKYSNINDNSIVIRVKYGSIGFLFTGDAEAEAEEVVLSHHGGALAADVLKVGHHGSRTSSTRDFIDAVKPRYALISCGKFNSFRHPHFQTVTTLEEADAKILRTDEDGFLIFQSDGKTIKWARTPIPFPATPFDPAGIENPAVGDWVAEGECRDGRVTMSIESVLESDRGAVLTRHCVRPVPDAEEWSFSAAIDGNLDRRVELGLVLMSDTANAVRFGVRELWATQMTVIRRGRTRIGPEIVAHRPTRLGFRKTKKSLDALAFDEDKNVWRVFWSIESDDLPALGSNAEVGCYILSPGGPDKLAGSFKNFRLDAGVASGRPGG